jgi:glutamate dehydrogenase/leucine dehydrogenase
VGSAISSIEVAAALEELQFEAALAGLDSGCAAVGLQLPSSPLNEQELWQIACESAPVVSRLLGDARLLPVDVASAAFSQWMSRAAAQFRMKLKICATDPSEYSSLEQASIARAIVTVSSFGLEEIGRHLRGAAVTVLGGGTLARRSIKAFHEAGARIVAVADQSGALVQSNGIEITPLLRHMELGGLLVEYPAAEHARHPDAIASPADVLLLATRTLEITDNNSSAVIAPIVIESSGLSFSARESLSARGVLVIPREITHCVRLLPGSRRFSGEEQDVQLLDRIWRETNTVAKMHRLPLHSAALVQATQWLAQRYRAARP